MDPQLPDPSATLEVSPEVVASWLELPRDQRPRLVDCREADELSICQIAGHDWIPLGKFPDSIVNLTGNTKRGVVVYCHHGMRSLRAASFLRANGVENAFSMRGGIEAWGDRLDPAMARY